MRAQETGYQIYCKTIVHNVGWLVIKIHSGRFPMTKLSMPSNPLVKGLFGTDLITTSILNVFDVRHVFNAQERRNHLIISSPY